jgi:hypothetical protein
MRPVVADRPLVSVVASEIRFEQSNVSPSHTNLPNLIATRALPRRVQEAALGRMSLIRRFAPDD